MKQFLLPLFLLLAFCAQAEVQIKNYAAIALKSLSRPTALAPANPNSEAMAKEALNRANLLFVENNGQLVDHLGNQHPEILFTAQSKGTKVFITSTSIHYVFTKTEGKPKDKDQLPDLKGDQKLVNDMSEEKVSTHKFTLSLVGADPKAELVKGNGQEYFENHYLAHCPNGIVAKSYERFTIKNVYPGVDWVIYSNGQGLKYDFVLTKASDASKIKLLVSDAKTNLTKSGDLEMLTSLGKVVEDRPVSLQNGAMLTTSFKALGNNTYGFEVNDVVENQPLTIDPSVEWSTYFGGDQSDYANAVSTDAAGNVYLVGRTTSFVFPVLSAFQNTPGSASVQDAYFAKFASNGTRQWVTYYGGSGADVAFACKTDPSGNLVIVGNTTSQDFPVASAYQATHVGLTQEAFLVKFTGAGNRVWATYLGGNDDDFGSSCAIDPAGNIYISGTTRSLDFPVLSGLQMSYSGGFYDAYVAKYNTSGSLLWSTYYGGNDYDVSYACCTDNAGNVYIAGNTQSANLTVLSGHKSTKTSFQEVYLAKLNGAGALQWATYYGGNGTLYATGFNNANSCTADASGNVYLAGNTNATDFPVASGTQSTNAGDSDMFLIKFSSVGVRQWATYYGGALTDDVSYCTTDAGGNIYLVGSTSSTDFPVTSAIQSNNAGALDVSVVKLSSAGSVLWSTYHGGQGSDEGKSCSVDLSGNVYLAGNSDSPDYPAFSNLQGNRVGAKDAILFKIANCTPPNRPVVSPAGPLTLANPVAPIVLTAPAGYNYLWSTNETTRSISVTTSGTYSVRIIQTGCVSQPSLPVVINDPINTTSYLWDGTDLFNNPNNWSFGNVPDIIGPFDTLVINSGECTLDQDRTYPNIVIRPGATLNLGDYTFTNTGWFENQGSVTSTALGRLTIDQGTVKTITTLSLANLRLGSTGNVTVLGSFSATTALWCDNTITLSGTNNKLILAASWSGAAYYDNRSTANFVGSSNNFVHQVYINPFTASLTNGVWAFFGSSINSMPVSQFGVGNQLAPNTYNNNVYDGSSIFLYNPQDQIWPLNKGWVKPTIGANLNRGYGARVWINMNRINQGPIEFTGFPEYSDISVPLLYCPNNCTFQSYTLRQENGFNLIGNPYPSTLNFDLVAKVNAMDALWIWRQAFLQYSSYTAGIGVNGGTNLIARGQAFLVYANGAGASLDFTKAASSVSNTSFFRQSVIDNVVRVKVSKAGKHQDETAIRLSFTATMGVDAGLEATKMMGTGTALYSLDSMGNKLAIQACPIPTISNTVRVPIMLEKLNTNHVLTFTGINSLTGGTDLYLNHQSFTAPRLIFEGDSLILTTALSQGLELVFSNNGLVSIDNNHNKLVDFSLLPNPAKDRVKLSGAAAGAIVRISNSIGQQIVNTTLNDNSEVDISSLSAGVYFVDVNGVRKQLVKE